MDWYQNEENNVDLCLEVVSRSCLPLRHNHHWIIYIGNR